VGGIYARPQRVLYPTGKEWFIHNLLLPLQNKIINKSCKYELGRKINLYEYCSNGLVIKLALPEKVTRRAYKVCGTYDRFFTNVQGDSSFTARAKTPTSNRFKILKKFMNDCVSL
jgi:hypothetical protein